MVVIDRILPKHPHGHIAIFNGTMWVSDFKQPKGVAGDWVYGSTMSKEKALQKGLIRYYRDIGSEKKPASATNTPKEATK